MHTLLATELELDGTALVKILHYDGTPITARFIVDAIRTHLNTMQQHPSQALQEMTA
jgi:2-oxoglutarate ferredoxin oxidoreductase subunit alpha